MSALILDGKAVAKNIRAKLRDKIHADKSKGLPIPGLAMILVGDNPASEIYVTNKNKACEEVGINSWFYHLDAHTTEQALQELIKELNHDPAVHGILLQLPLPKHLQESHLLESIIYTKDVDGFHPMNLGRLAARIPSLRPCTPLGIIMLLEQYKISLQGKHVVVVGASNIVGRPMALEALMQNATVTITHKSTVNLQSYIEKADIVVAAIGKFGIIQTEWLAPHAIVIDVGINRLADGRLSGDIDFTTAVQRVHAITPVPGGVGPMTITALLENTYRATRSSEQTSDHHLENKINVKAQDLTP